MENINMVYHQPVMLKESIEALDVKADGIYVDVTFGGGGHSKAILERLRGGLLIAFDQDIDAFHESLKINLPNFHFVLANFRFLKQKLFEKGIYKVQGIFADLGVSSHQLDTPERGFSIRFDAHLDMRMNKQYPLTAKTILNTYTEENLQRVFSHYGEVRNAKTLARYIIKHREKEKIQTTFQLNAILDKLAPVKKEKNKYKAQVYQALRIEINDEINALKDLLIQSSAVLVENGRLVIISYHSLEDRLVKNYLHKGCFEGEPEKDLFGNVKKPFNLLTKKALTPSLDELRENKRARSARLRIGIKT
jgi:16S rRNA (cytosine1402-N4)-methyltransferase